MRKKIIKTLLLTTTLISLFTVGASAEWRQIGNEIWTYNDSNGMPLKDTCIDNEYYVDSNGLWIKSTTENKTTYCSIQYDKKTGVIWGKGTALPSCPVTQITREYGTQKFDMIYVKYSDFEQGLNVFDNYHVVNDNGVWKVEKINKDIFE